MPKINIANLSKEKVILALFNNAFEKSIAAIQSKITLKQSLTNDPSIYREPTEYEIARLLRDQGEKIGYIGCVEFNMDFSNDLIDTDYYDQTHVSKNNPEVKSALLIINEIKSFHKSNILNNSNYQILDIVMSKKTDTTYADITKIENKLEKLFGEKCQLCHCNSNIHSILFLPIPPAQEKLQMYALQLSSLGIKTDVPKPIYVMRKRINISAKLFVDTTIDEILIKLAIHNDNLTLNGSWKK